MLLDYLQPELINEIISAKEYKVYKEKLASQYRPFNTKDYKKTLPVLKKLFTELNGGKFARTVIFDYNQINSKILYLNPQDKKMIEILNKAGYEVTDVDYTKKLENPYFTSL